MMHAVFPRRRRRRDKAEFVLGERRRELARVRTGTIKRMKADAETAERKLADRAVAAAGATSGIPIATITRCCIGTAGETVPLVVNWLRKRFAHHVGGELDIVGDVEIALDSAFFGGRGVLVLAGTGSNVAGRAATGRMVTAGGWGPALADQGSGHFLGLEALRRGFLAIDQQRPTRLLDLAHDFWKLGSFGELIEFANANPAPEYSRLAPLVVAAAEQGDVVAQEVRRRAGRIWRRSLRWSSSTSAAWKPAPRRSSRFPMWRLPAAFLSMRLRCAMR